MKKIFLILLVGIFFIACLTQINAGKLTLGTFKQNENVRIVQVCDDATYVNISSVSYPNGSVALSETKMNPIGSGEFYYDFSNTLELGTYDVRGISDGCENTFTFYFDITPSGRGGTENIVLTIFIIIMAYGLTLVGVLKRNAPLTALGGMFMMFLGIYLINNGIIIYRDTLTNYFSYITIFLGAIFSVWSAYSIIGELGD